MTINKYKTKVNYDLINNVFTIFLKSLSQIDEKNDLELIYFCNKNAIAIDDKSFKNIRWLNFLDIELCLSDRNKFYIMEKSINNKIIYNPPTPIFFCR